MQVDTASGAYNDIEAIGKAIKAAGHPALFMVDTVASLGCMPFEMDAWGIDVAMSGSQKGLMTPPGLGFCRRQRPRPARCTRRPNLRTPYWDWTEREGTEHYRKYGGTAPIHLLFALRQAIDMIDEEGLENVFLRHRLLAEAVRRAVSVWAEGQVLGFNIAEAGRAVEHRHDGGDGDSHDPVALQRYCKEKCGVVLGVGIGELHRPGVPDRPYGPRQRADDPGHARRHRSRPPGARHSPRQGRRRGRDRLARRNV